MDNKSVFMNTNNVESELTAVGGLNLPQNAVKYVVHPQPEVHLPFDEPNKSLLTMIGRGALIGLTMPLLYPLIKMTVVPAGHVGLAWHGADPTFLRSGRHFLMSLTHRFQRAVAENESVIEHGNFVRVRVMNGQLGFAIDTATGDPVFLTPGTHLSHSSTFKWVKFLDLSQSSIDCGTFQWIRVETGKVGIAYINAQLQILQPGLHLLRRPDRFHCFLSTQQQILSLNHKLDSADYISIDLTADVFFLVSNPELAFTRAFENTTDLINSIHETAISTLSMIIRSSTFAQIGTGNASNQNTHEAIDAPPSYESYQKHLHDEFVNRLQKYMLETYGIYIENIRIKSLSIHDPNLAKKIAEPAVVYAQTQAALANVKSQTEIQTAEAHREATVKRIKADADAYTLVKEAESKCKTIELNTVAETNKLVALANAKANAVLIEAKAEKEKLELEGEGNRLFAQKVGESQLGKDLALGRVQASSLAGVQKVIYAPSSALPAIMFSNLNSNTNT
eukprot:TRINITY_DN938_c0_g1_i1.p1 TRINITY_DN938_c0_g1~~TRINITY_DN938_c0_g1_i1.p1  ORF type:complete len:524 (-),score=159.44 TRINITY_DN938_c0_g1_i1:379-1899(-)